jgi:hypothetical protein
MARKGIQWWMTTRSGPADRMALAVLNQLRGLTELIRERMRMSAGGFPSSNCVLPGKRNPGYCTEKEMMLARWPDLIKLLQSAVLKLAIPPRSGYAGPMQIMFKVYRFMVSSIR